VDFPVVYQTTAVTLMVTGNSKNLHVFNFAVLLNPENLMLAIYTGFPCLLENSGIFIGKFPGPGKSWEMTLVLESPGNLLANSWKVLEFARQ